MRANGSGAFDGAGGLGGMLMSMMQSEEMQQMASQLANSLGQSSSSESGPSSIPGQPNGMPYAEMSNLINGMFRVPPQARGGGAGSGGTGSQSVVNGTGPANGSSSVAAPTTGPERDASGAAPDAVDGDAVGGADGVDCMSILSGSGLTESEAQRWREVIGADESVQDEMSEQPPPSIPYIAGGQI